MYVPEMQEPFSFFSIAITPDCPGANYAFNTLQTSRAKTLRLSPPSDAHSIKRISMADGGLCSHVPNGAEDIT